MAILLPQRVAATLTHGADVFSEPAPRPPPKCGCGDAVLLGAGRPLWRARTRNHMAGQRQPPAAPLVRSPAQAEGPRHTSPPHASARERSRRATKLGTRCRLE